MIHHLVIYCVLSIIIRDFLVFEIRKNLDFRKISIAPKIFIKIEIPLYLHIASSWQVFTCEETCCNQVYCMLSQNLWQVFTCVETCCNQVYCKLSQNLWQVFTCVETCCNQLFYLCRNMLQSTLLLVVTKFMANIRFF